MSSELMVSAGSFCFRTFDSFLGSLCLLNTCVVVLLSRLEESFEGICSLFLLENMLSAAMNNMSCYFVQSNNGGMPKINIGRDGNSIIDLFYSTMNDFNNSNIGNDKGYSMMPLNDKYNTAKNEYCTNDEVREETPDKKDTFLNKGLSNYLDINQCERQYNLYRAKKKLLKEQLLRETPQIISNYSLIRLFNAVTLEHIYGIVMKMIKDGHIKWLVPLEDSKILPHPVVNYSIFQFFDSTLYEKYITSMLLPPNYRQNLKELTLNPRYAFMSYVTTLVECSDEVFYFKDIKTTFKAVLLTILNSNHIKKSKSIIELSSSGCFHHVVDPRNNPKHSSFIARLFHLSVMSFYLLAMNKALGGDLSVRRVDSAKDDIYTQNKTGNHCLRFQHKNVMYFAARDDIWVFRLDENDKYVYYHNNLMDVIFPRKLSTF